MTPPLRCPSCYASNVPFGRVHDRHICAHCWFRFDEESSVVPGTVATGFLASFPPNPDVLSATVQSAGGCIPAFLRGVMLSVRSINEGSRRPRPAVGRKKSFPSALGEAFRHYFSRRFPNPGEFRRDVLPGLSVILAAYEALPVGMLQRVLGWDTASFGAFTRSVEALFQVATVDSGPVIRPFHPFLGEWLQDERQAGLYWVRVAEGHRMLADLGARDLQGGVLGLDAYFLRYLPLHLLRSERATDADLLLKDEGFHVLRQRVKLPDFVPIEEAMLRFPDVAEFIETHEGYYRSALSDCVAHECSFDVGARDLSDQEADRLRATKNNYDGDIYRHWEYDAFDAVTADGRIQRDFVPEGRTLAAVLPQFAVPPVVIIQMHHLSGQCGGGDQYGHREDITLFRVPPVLRCLQKKGVPFQPTVDGAESGVSPALE